MATPTEWLNEFQVNLGAANTPGTNAPKIIGLSNGNFLVAWEEEDTTGVATQAGRDIVAKIFDAEGNLVRDTYRLNVSSTNNDEGDFDIAATNDGGFILVYREPETANQSELHWEKFNDLGNNTNTRNFAIENVAGDNLFNPQIVVNNSNNTSYVTWTSSVGGNEDIEGIRLSATGTTLTAQFDAGQNNASDDDIANDSAILTNGNLVTVYREADAGVFSIEAKAVNTAGVQIFNISVTDTANTSEPKVTSLTNGNWVAVWNDGNDIKYKVFNATGGGVSVELTAAGGANSQNEPDIEALPDGGFVIGWDDDTAGNFQARAFFANGAADGSTFTVETTGVTSPDMGVTGDGRVLFTWDNEGADIFASIWDPREGTIDANDYDGGNPPLNFVNSGDIITANVTGSTINGNGSSETLLGQGGSDIINGGGGLDTITGGGGNDTISGGFATDSIDGGSGNDTIIQGNGEFIDDVTGGSGSDTLDASGVTNASEGITIDSDAGTWTGSGGTRTFTSIENVIGTQQGDDIFLDVGSSTIDGQGGDDTIAAGFSTDSILGGAGNDLIIQGNGEFIDDINGGTGSDTLDASDVTTLGQGINVDLAAGTWAGLGGTQTLTSVETIIGTQLADTIDAGSIGGISIHGQDGNDTLIGGLQSQTIDGGNGNDFIDGGVAAGSGVGDSLLGGAGDDTILGADGSDTVEGGSGNDSISTNGGNDIVDGGNQDDKIVSGTGNDTVTGGNGNDSINAGDGNDSITGDAGLDTLRGGTGTDRIDGGLGDDVIFGGEGLDTIFGGGGADELRGGAGDSSISGDIGNDRLIGNSGIDNLDGGADDDVLIGFLGDDIMVGGSGNDIMRGLGGADSMDGGSGDDNIQGGTGNDIMNGGAGIDRMNGGSENDTIRGDDGNDIISGGSGFDFIEGGAGNDVLFGERAGFGGLGQTDLFVFDDGHGTDRIRDWKDGSDLIDFSAHSAYNNILDVLASISQTGSTVRIESSPSDILIIENAVVADFSNSDFVF